MFYQNFQVGKISQFDPNSGGKTGYAEVQCLPFYSILLATNITQIDYFSLDVEGHELEILKTIPWDKIEIKVVYSLFNIY